MIEDKINEMWRLTPYHFAQKVSEKRWIPYRHLVYTSNLILPGLINGGGRYIINMPPRHGKSEFISQYVPAWYLHLFKHHGVIMLSYEHDYAVTWGRKVRNILETSPYINMKLATDSKAAHRFHTDEHGTCISTGIGGAITGKGGQLIIIDDPHKNRKEASSETICRKIRESFEADIMTRLEPGGTVVILMTRWSQLDLTEFCLFEHDEEWTHINLPAIAEENDPLGRKEGEALCPERYNEEALAGRKKAVGSMTWAGLYQQRPAPAEGAIWKRSWWQYYDELPEKLDEVIQSWDMRFKDNKEEGSFVVGQVWGRKGSNKYLIDEYRDRWDFNDTKKAVIRATLDHPKAYLKLIENKANGAAVENDLKNAISGIKLVEPEGGKEARANACQPQLEAGNVYLPNPKHASWVNEFIMECSVFPNGKVQDRVDAASQALIHLEAKTNSSLFKITQM